MIIARIFPCLLVVSTLALAACVSPRIRGFEGVQVGMLKDQVLEQAGSPQRVKRVQGRDHWTYVYLNRNSEDRITKTVQFEDGRVVYVGEPTKPKISAEEQDQINERIELQAQHDEEVAKKHRAEEYRQVMGPASVEEESRKVAPAYTEVP